MANRGRYRDLKVDCCLLAKGAKSYQKFFNSIKKQNPTDLAAEHVRFSTLKMLSVLESDMSKGDKMKQYGSERRNLERCLRKLRYGLSLGNYKEFEKSDWTTNEPKKSKKAKHAKNAKNANTMLYEEFFEGKRPDLIDQSAIRQSLPKLQNELSRDEKSVSDGVTKIRSQQSKLSERDREWEEADELTRYRWEREMQIYSQVSLETEENPEQVIQGPVLRNGRELDRTPENIDDPTVPFLPLPDSYDPSEYPRFATPTSFDLQLDDEWD